MPKKQNNTLTVHLNLTDDTEVDDLQAYVFSSGGKPLGSARITGGEPARIEMTPDMDGHPIKVVLGPVIDEAEVTPSISALKRAGAHVSRARYLIEEPQVNIHIPGIYLGQWCGCTVRGRVVNRVALPDGSIEEMPVCNARVHICEVDPWYLTVLRIPDYEIYTLRDDLIKRFDQGPAIPRPDPGPFLKFDPTPIARPRPFDLGSIAESAVVVSEAGRDRVAPHAALSVLANTNDVQEIRSQLLQLEHFLYPYFCYFRHIWPFYRMDCVRTVEVDSSGHFSATIFYDCKDQPDLYFWVEQLQDGVWTTVYKPTVACHTNWNYVCGTEVVINAPNADPCEEPGYDIPGGVTLFVMPYKVGHTHIWGTPSGAPTAPLGWVRSDGLVDYHAGPLGMLYNAPFGSVLHFRHDDSYFIPKGDTDPGAGDNSINFYRYSYRRSGTTGDWNAMTTPQSRGYRMEYNDGSLPTYESYPIPPQTVGGEPNLFEFKPRTPPTRPIDPSTVVVREWLTGNLNDVAASWNTSTTAPPINAVNTTDDAGTFDVKIEVFDGSGQLVMPGAGTFEFLALNSDKTTSRIADAGEISGGGFVFRVHVDNNTVNADIPQPKIGATQASDDCGFLRYDDSTDLVHVEFVATHPNDRAVFDMTVKRGSGTLANASTAGVYTETAASSASPYNDVGGVYQHNFTAAALVGTCVNAAFAAHLRVWGKATNGVHRLGLDSGSLIAFALAESED